MITSWYGNSWYGEEWYQETAVLIDTHDGFDSRKREHEEKREKRAELRSLLEVAFAPQAAPSEVSALAAPYVQRLESGRIEIDWARIEKSVIHGELAALARRMADDEEEILLLWSH